MARKRVFFPGGVIRDQSIREIREIRGQNHFQESRTGTEAAERFAGSSLRPLQC
jgi:hypothetical protein